MEQFMKINTAVNGFVWGPVMLALLVGTGIYLSIAVGFIQFTKIGYWWKNTIGKIFKKGEAGDGEITPLQAVSTALASTVGTGNIAGVTGAIILGGPGAVFWMWVSALFGMVTKFSEVTLAVKYRERNEKGDWCGGPMYYIKNGLGPKWKWLGTVFAVLGAIGAQLRRLFYARVILSAGGGQKELMELTGLKSYPASLTMTAARRVTDGFCQKAVELVLQTDVAMKTGADDPERLLELLLVQLSQEARHG